MSDSKTSSGGVGFFGLLTIAFIVLKLCKMIDWSWIWVTCPFWGMWAIYLIWSSIYSVLKQRKAKDEHERNDSGYNMHSWENGGRSRWQQRLDEMRKQQAKSKVN